MGPVAFHAGTYLCVEYIYINILYIQMGAIGWSVHRYINMYFSSLFEKNFVMGCYVPANVNLGGAVGFLIVQNSNQSLLWRRWEVCIYIYIYIELERERREMVEKLKFH